MTTKRFEIVKSKLIKDGWVISDKLKQFTFPTLKGDKRALVSYCKALNELHEEKEQLLSDKEHLMGYLIRFRSFDDDDLDYVMNRESNKECGKQYYKMKEEDW